MHTDDPQRAEVPREIPGLHQLAAVPPEVVHHVPEGALLLPQAHTHALHAVRVHRGRARDHAVHVDQEVPLRQPLLPRGPEPEAGFQPPSAARKAATSALARGVSAGCLSARGRNKEKRVIKRGGWIPLGRTRGCIGASDVTQVEDATSLHRGRVTSCVGRVGGRLRERV